MSNNPVLIVFSAIPGSGKSSISKCLEEKYDFLRFANKDIRDAFRLASIESNSDLVSEYTLWLLSRIVATGHPTIVFERNIDQWHEKSKIWALEKGYRYFLIRLDVSGLLLEKRLLARERTIEAEAFKVLDFYDSHHNLVGNKHAPDLVLKEDYDLDYAAKATADIVAR